MREEKSREIENPLPVTELLARADQGDADCQYWAGIRYFLANGVPKDPHKAVDYCWLAAAQGHAKARAFLAYCYDNGIVLPRDLKSSVRLYRYSAAKGYAPAQFSLGMYYLHGRGVRKNVRLAVKWLERCAAQDDVEALVLLGKLFNQGEVVVQDEERACRYFRRAAGLGHPEGQFQFGGMLFGGHGVERDVVAALEYLDLSAAQGFEGALTMQAHMDEFVIFAPAEAGYKNFPVDHPFPVRRRTSHLMAYLRIPCFRMLARDVYHYVQKHPKDAEPGLEDVARLLAAAAEKGEALLPLFPGVIEVQDA